MVQIYSNVCIVYFLFSYLDQVCIVQALKNKMLKYKTSLCFQSDFYLKYLFWVEMFYKMY
jgi:hypothetical protein